MVKRTDLLFLFGMGLLNKFNKFDCRDSGGTPVARCHNKFFGGRGL
jgi:hypothetical protein